MSIVIVLINYNGTPFLDKCLKSVLSQTHPHKLTIIDNVSTDHSVQFLQKNFPQIPLIANKTNNGYAGAANQAVQIATEQGAKYLMILNPDIILPPDYLQKSLSIIAQDPKIAAFTGKILRYDFAQNKPTNYIDSVGLHCYRNRRIVDYGQGQEDKGQFDQPREVFGVSGSCPIYRLEALHQVAVTLPNGTKEIFDEDFFMYKEDVDLSWRLLLQGWKNYYHPAPTAYHGRGTGILQDHDHFSVYRNRRKASSLAKYHAYKNQRLMMLKNETWPSFFLDFPHILFKELLISGYILFREPRLLKSSAQLLKQAPKALQKRRQIMKQKTTSSSKIRPFLR